jgi:hypothetical protein
MEPRTSLVLFAVLAGALALSPSQTPGAKPGVKAPAKKEKLTYPTFEPFVLSRMWDVTFGEDIKAFDIEKTVKELEDMAKVMDSTTEATDGFKPKPREGAPSALLTPALPTRDRYVFSVLPPVMMKVQPLWSAKKWSAEDVALGTQAAKFVKLLPGAPELAFEIGADGKNHQQMESLVRWFDSAVERPEHYSAMIVTMDFGPYAGLPFEAAAPLPAAQMAAMGDKSELRLCRIEGRKEPWVLQCVREGKLLWSRVLSDSPDESVSEVEFFEEEPVQEVGRYGWKVRLYVTWMNGEETAYVYVDREGKFLFYYMSW